jgi:predicted amidohydrolase YtcJ
MQPVHATSDGGWVGDRIGPARVEEGAYVWRKLLASGAALAVGTDVPVEDIDPIANCRRGDPQARRRACSFG